MAQVFGRLREGKSTYGEKEVLKRLKTNLPKEFSALDDYVTHLTV